MGTAIAGPAALTTAISEATGQSGPVPAPDQHPLSQVRALSESGRWDEFSRERETAVDVIQAVEFTLDQTSAGSGVDLVIVCDILRVRGEIKLPGQNVTLAARLIEASSGAIIDCSGRDGIEHRNRAEDGRTPGNKGADGKKGENGAPGGRISIYAGAIEGTVDLLTNGGRGGKGQTGGTGAIGIAGPPGSGASRRNPPGDGGPGGQGGKGGDAGEGGDGGDAGQIQIIAFQPLPGSVHLHSVGGIAGNAGVPGAGGSGGLGGPAGDPCYYQMGHGRPGDDWFEPGGEVCYERHARQGPTGPQGAPGDGPKNVPKSGAEKQALVRQGTIDEVAPAISITALKMTLSRAELDFVNEVTEGLEGRLSWIYQVANSSAAGQAYYSQRASRNLNTKEVGEPSRDEWLALSAKASQLLNRFRYGLDPFGYARSYVSSLSPKFLKEMAISRFAIASELEKAHDQYFDAQSDINLQRAALREAFAKAKDAIQILNTDAGENERKADEAQNNILALSVTLEELRREILSADREFQSAVARQGGCNIGKMVQFVAGVIAVAYGAYAGYTAIAGAFATINDPGNWSKDDSFIKQIQFVGKTFSESDAGKRFEEMQKGFRQVEEALKKNDTKIVVSLEAFEEQLSQFMSLPEAQRYRDLMRRLADVARARNEAQLAYTQCVMKAEMLHAQSRTTQLEADRVSRLLAASDNPVLSECVSYLRTFLAETKQSILEILDLQRRSLIYVTLSPIRPSYRWTTVAELRAAQGTFDDALTKAMDRRGGSELEYECLFAIDRRTNPGFFSLVTSKDGAAFTIPFNDRQFNRGGTAFVTVQEVAFEFKGLRTVTNEFTCRLTHGGASIAWDQHKNLMTFNHTPRTTILSFKRDGTEWKPTVAHDNNLRGRDSEYLHLSPFATWHLWVVPDDKPDFSGVSKLVFSFKARCVPTRAPNISKDLLDAARI